MHRQISPSKLRQQQQQQYQQQQQQPRSQPQQLPQVARPPTKLRRPPLWSTAALMLVAGGTTCLGLCLGFVLRGVRDERVTALSLSRVVAAADAPAAADPAASADPTAAADPAAAAAVATGGGMVKRYASFEEYAKEMFASGGGGSGRNRTLAVPVVDSPATVQSIGRSMVLPLATIIGVQKGGTQSLRNHLKTHPLLAGINSKETHFFDRGPQWYPRLGAWPGDGREEQLSPAAAGHVLEEYAKVSMHTVNSKATHGTVTVGSSPRYIFNPLAPFRMGMVQPFARLVLVLRDPTDRWVRRDCRQERDRSLSFDSHSPYSRERTCLWLRPFAAKIKLFAQPPVTGRNVIISVFFVDRLGCLLESDDGGYLAPSHDALLHRLC
ncbi:unnamed protein product [Ectocarpus sp. 4 AP-2014]